MGERMKKYGKRAFGVWADHRTSYDFTANGGIFGGTTDFSNRGVASKFFGTTHLFGGAGASHPYRQGGGVFVGGLFVWGGGGGNAHEL